MKTEVRHGDYMITATGRRFYPLDPRPEEIHIEDVAKALSKVCRFGGHMQRFYSVAEHSIRVSQLCLPCDALAGLLHDAPEAYLGDMIRPLKRQPEMQTYQQAEARVWAAVCQRFSVVDACDYALPASVLHADEVLLVTEARDLTAAEWWRDCKHVEPLAETIKPYWDCFTVERLFLARFRELTQ